MARYTYVISDIHGQFDLFMRILKLINFSFDDELYILGDIIDRGDKSIECIQFIMEQDNILSLLGNHELLFLDNYLHGTNGIYNAIEEIRNKLPNEKIKEIANWISDMPECKLIKINNKNFFLNHTQAISSTYFKEDLSTRMFPNYLRYQNYYCFNAQNIISIFGHIPTMQMRMWNNQGNESSIWKNKNSTIFDIDCGAGYLEQGGCLGCLRLNDMKEFYV